MSLTQAERELLIDLAAKYKALGNFESAQRCLDRANPGGANGMV